MSELDDLREELAEFAQPERPDGRPPHEERIVVGFEDIQRFVDRHGHVPQHGEDRDIFERLYAVRLDRLRTSEECQVLLAPLDRQGLLNGAEDTTPQATDDELLAVLDTPKRADRITDLRHVRPRSETRAVGEVADRASCEDFDRFRPLFEQAERDIESGLREARPFGKDASISVGNTFILGGQLVYVAEVGEAFAAPNGEPDARLRVIYANGTESNLLLRSLQRALYKDETGRRLTDPDFGPLFGRAWEEEDVESGTIYVLRSLSKHPFIAEHQALIHKIGVTSGTVESRVAGAAHDATYLLADVEVVATYKLAGIRRTKLEGVFHRVFAAAQLDLTIQDRFGHPVRPREWFLVPLAAIDEAVERVRDGSIAEVVYDPKTAGFVRT